jgi:hypothetical protein
LTDENSERFKAAGQWLYDHYGYAVVGPGGRIQYYGPGEMIRETHEFLAFIDTLPPEQGDGWERGGPWQLSDEHIAEWRRPDPAHPGWYIYR